MTGMELNLDGMVAVVTGAASGIGRGSAQALAEQGAAVVVSDIDAVGLDETRQLVANAGGRVAAQLCDVSSASQVDGLVRKAVDTFGGLDVMHANAAIGLYKNLEDMTEPDLDRVLSVNLKGPLLCAKQAIAPMRSRGGGSVIFTSSVQATHSLPGCVAYAAAKAGLLAAARTLSTEVGNDGIRVNAISPGTIDTPMLQRDLEGMDLEQADDFLRNVRAANSLNRIGTITEVASAVVFLASSASTYVTGTNLVVDGGFTAVKRF